MSELNHQAEKINSEKAEIEGHNKIDVSPTATAKYIFIAFVLLLMTFFIGLYFYWNH